MSTAEFLGSTLHVLTSITTLFLTASARPQAFQPVAGGFCRVAMVLTCRLCWISPPRPLRLDWMWCSRAGALLAEEVKKAPACWRWETAPLPARRNELSYRPPGVECLVALGDETAARIDLACAELSMAKHSLGVIVALSSDIGRGSA